MKKSMILLGMLSIGYAYAQSTDPYEGKVGINTTEPKATLDITPEANNLTGTTNEGIIAPRLTKTRIANIEASKLTEGTLVYSTDAVYTAGADTAKNNRVAKINEKGYYFYNGTEWVKVQYKDTNDAEWVYDDTTKRINLKRSGQATGFTAKVFFDSEKGRYINVDTTENVMREANVLGADITSNILTEGSSFNVSHLKADKINTNYSNQRFYYASKDESFLQVNNEATKKSGLHLKGHFSNLNTYTYTDANTTENLGSLAGGYFRAIHRGTGKVQNSIIGSVSTGIIKNGSTNGVYGAHNYSLVQSAGEVSTVVGTFTQNQLGKDNIVLNVKNVYGSLTNNIINSGGKIANLYGALANTSLSTTTQALEVENITGFRYDGIVNTITPAHTIGTHYGVYIANIAGAKDDKNYAVYTNAGKVRVGDLADTSATGNRQVVVDADGVLKVANTEAAPTTISGKADIPCDETNRGKMNLIQDHTSNGKTFDVFGICLKGTNGYSWRYIYGNAGVSNGSGNFGSGLQ